MAGITGIIGNRPDEVTRQSNEFNVALTDPRLEVLGIDPNSLLGGRGLTESEVTRRLEELKKRKAMNEVAVTKKATPPTGSQITKG